MKFLYLMFKNLKRNPIRSVLTTLAVVCLVSLFSIIGSVLRFLDLTMTEKSKDVKLVVTERYRIPSRFDRSYMESAVRPGSELNSRLTPVSGFHADQNNTWIFVVFTLDPDDPPKDKDLQFFVIATEPEKIPTMVDGLADLDPKLCDKMKHPPVSGKENTGILIGPERLKLLKKKVGDVFPCRSVSHRDGSPARKPLEMEFEVVGELPAGGRWEQGAFIDAAYVNRVFKEKKNEFDGKVNLGWLMVDDQDSGGTVSGTIEENIRDVKVETGATATSRFLASFKDLLRGVKYLLAPAIVVVMIVIVANAISITARERTKEMAVMKVLGFGKGRILTLVLGEGVLVGVLGGLIGAALTYGLINEVLGGLKLPIAFFGVFFISGHVWWWGPVLGGATAVLGGFLPSWTACQVRPTEVFAKVA